MAERWRAVDLLRRARDAYDAPDSPLRGSAAQAWRTGFDSGGEWMRRALECLRGQPLSAPVRGLNRLGLTKYALAGTAALVPVAVAVWLPALLASALEAAARQDRDEDGAGDVPLGVLGLLAEVRRGLEAGEQQHAVQHAEQDARPAGRRAGAAG